MSAEGVGSVGGKVITDTSIEFDAQSGLDGSVRTETAGLGCCLIRVADHHVSTDLRLRMWLPAGQQRRDLRCTVRTECEATVSREPGGDGSPLARRALQGEHSLGQPTVTERTGESPDVDAGWLARLTAHSIATAGSHIEPRQTAVRW